MDALMVKHTFHASGPLCWGPLQWMTLHQLARGYPRSNPSTEVQEAARAYVMALVKLLPCSICAMHWKDVAPTVKTGSRAEFLKWTIDVHNSVNKRTGKKELTYTEALHAIRDTCNDNCLSVNTIGGQVGGSDEYKAATIVLAVLAAMLAVILIVVLACKLAAKSPQA